jgi:hypothetical protein
MTTALMTKIDSTVYTLFSELAKKHQTTKKKMLEHIILFYHKQQEQQLITEAYQTMANDEAYLQEMQENSVLLGHL